MFISNKKNNLYKKIKKNFKYSLLVKKKKFKNNEIFVDIKHKKKIKNIFFLFKFSKNINEEIIEMLMVLYIIYKKKISMFIPYFPYSRQDKKEKNKNNCISFSFMLFILKCFKINKLITVDIHTDKIFNNFGLNILNLKTTMFIKKIINNKKITVVFADFGCFRRYFKIIKYVKKFIIFEKKRNKKNVKLNILYKQNVNKKILIIDDLMDSGKTILKIRNYLKNNFLINNINIYITHLIAKKKIIKKFYKNKIYTTDTFYKKKIKNVNVYSVYDLLK
ncbi:ribose-phosphate diphosphokinase [Candidatus Vidania fulgoroideorum]